MPADGPALPGAGELHLWLSRRAAVGGSDRMLREVLSRYTGVAPAIMRITRGPQGKPALASVELPLAFNLSGSGDWFAMAVSGGAPVGIDLEYCDTQRDVLRLARRCFSKAELADLQACSGRQRIDRFYDYWTLKEAHVKAAGGSLGRELETTGFVLHYPGATSGGMLPGTIRALAPVSTAATAWYCLLQPLAGYRIAICCCAPQDFSAGLRLCEIPGGGGPVERPPGLRAVSMLADSTAEAACL